ncbi:NitT/TauT family transport system permease protein [Acetitomaculum ruminis DSM 5522]|uniref:NitT/TauT family transport system permease protein n=1 Tax=Acetitomaculum ruminis DSM 5522 TaxID=1120918 RepID=A0A1I1A203_9FIRM|nr:ABC transporter permease [Acetitomaculum ruminis]SFB32024.1 NitT/TauT family transport system permease protein [Acetitomaculum ruminis DSM 5522]
MEKELKERKQVARIFRNLIPIIIFLVIWELCPRLGILNKNMIPPFSDAIVALKDMIVSLEIFRHLGWSLYRAVLGFSLALVIGIPLGTAIGWNEKIREFLSPLLTLFGNVSPIALFPFFIIVFGIGEVSKIGIVFWGCLWPMFMNTISGVSHSDKALIKAARTMGASKKTVLFSVVIPNALPEIYPGIKLSVSNSILMLCAGEMLGATAGLGYLISYSQQIFEMSKMYASIIIIALLGLAFTAILNTVEKRVFAWKFNNEK